jgi:hypothetical protein
MDNKKKWGDQPSKPPQKWSPEVYQLKLVMEAKLKCQNLAHHRFIKGRWELDITNYNVRGDMHKESSWTECEICNK